MANTIKAAVLLKNQSYFGGSAVLKNAGFQREFMYDYEHGWGVPYTDNGLGQPTTATSFYQQNAQPTGGVRCTRFLYTGQNHLVDEYWVSCGSAEFDAAMTSTNPQAFTALAALSPYTTVG